MPFGLKAAPSTFQRIMNSILSELLGNRRSVYTDDLLILDKSLKEHNTKLTEVFQDFREFNIKIEPDKSKFLKEELSYLGHVVTANGGQAG
jgi:hypothetical protein